MSKTKQSPPRKAPNRREALVTIGGCACVAATVASVGCTYSEVYGSLTVQTVPFDLADEAYSALHEVGQMVAVDAGGWQILLIRRDENSIIGLDRICPHAFCDMAPNVTGAWENDTLICVCHDSRFGPDGALLQGPAEVGIRAHDVRFDPMTGKGVFVTGGTTDGGSDAEMNDAGSVPS